MDTFLTDMYDRGLVKTAVAGPAIPPQPEEASVRPLDAEIKAPAKKTTPPEEPTAAEKKAELVLMAMRATRNAPPHIKTAAARYTGEKLAFLGVHKMEHSDVEKQFMYKMTPEQKKAFWAKHGKKE